jgi:hypothetical protein
MQTNLDRRGRRRIPIICHCLDPPSFSLPTTFNNQILSHSSTGIKEIDGIHMNNKLLTVFIFRDRGGVGMGLGIGLGGGGVWSLWPAGLHSC